MYFELFGALPNKCSRVNGGGTNIPHLMVDEIELKGSRAKLALECAASAVTGKTSAKRR